MRCSRLSLLLLPMAVGAIPQILDPLFCTVNVLVINVLQQDPQATTYCSSYLSIQTRTLLVHSPKLPVP